MNQNLSRQDPIVYTLSTASALVLAHAVNSGGCLGTIFLLPLAVVVGIPLAIIYTILRLFKVDSRVILPLSLTIALVTLAVAAILCVNTLTANLSASAPYPAKHAVQSATNRPR